MKNKTDNLDKGYMCTIIYCIIAILKWLFFSLCIVSAAFTIGFIVMCIFRGDMLTNTMVAKMYSYITLTDEVTSLELIANQGMFSVVITGIMYGVTATVTNGIIYDIFNKFNNILISIITGDMYTEENVKVLQKIFPTTFILAFFKPIMVFILADTFGVLKMSDIRLSGLAFFFAAFVLKVIFEKGYELEKKNTKITNELSDYKAREAEFKMAEIVNEETIKSLKKTVKALEPKEEKKVTTKKVVVKEKKETTAKAVKKETKKETVPKKTVKKEVPKKKQLLNQLQ